MSLRRWYRRGARAILGVRESISGEAVFVRLGWLPLDYLLACHGLRWFLKCWFGRCGTRLRRRLRKDGIHNNPDFVFFNRAHEFLVYLEGISGFDLFSTRMLKDDSLIREAMYMDLTRCWTNYQGAGFTRGIHEEWRADSIELMMDSRLGWSLVNGAVCGNSIFRDDMSRRGYTGSIKCRWGCDTRENVTHVLLHCHCYSEQRSKMREICRQENVNFTVKNLLSHPRLVRQTERFFQLFYSDCPS